MPDRRSVDPVPGQRWCGLADRPGSVIPLSGRLRDAYHLTRTEPEEISEPFVAAHRDLCDRLDLDPGEIADRLNRLVGRCDFDTIDVYLYTDLLGEHAPGVGRSVHS
nr:hypothetical protein [Micromonospora sp. DSM 115978]